MICLLVLSSIALLGFSLSIFVEKELGKEILLIVTFSALVSINAILIATVIFDSFSTKEPTAMDVYQGKTTLKYTVVDSIITDSTVIFRKEDL